MVNLYVGITDYDWFSFLAAQDGVDEVNFWQPGGRINFQAWREDGSGTALTRAQRKPTIA